MYVGRKKNKVKNISKIVLISFFCTLFFIATAYAMVNSRIRFNATTLAYNTLEPESKSTATWEISNTDNHDGQYTFDVQISIENHDGYMNGWSVELYTHADVLSVVCYHSENTTLDGEKITFEPKDWNREVNDGATLILGMQIKYATTADISHVFGTLVFNDLIIKNFTNRGGAYTGDSTPPTITLVQSAPIDGTVSINITASDSENDIELLKIAEGNQIISYFLTRGIGIPVSNTNHTENKTYDVTKNGIYTVYALDSENNSSIATIVINSIFDTTPPVITLSSNPPTSNNTVAIDIWVVDTESSITALKYANGEQSMSYFESSGNVINVLGTNLSESKKFTVTQIGTYTVYAEDSEGNASVSTIIIDSVIQDITPPVITLSQGIPLHGKVEISIQAVDEKSNITSIKIATGNQNLDYFMNGGISLSIPGNTKNVETTYLVQENNTYTVYSEELSGNKSISTIVVNSIILGSASTATWKEEFVWTATPYDGQVEMVITNNDGDLTNYAIEFKVPSDTTIRNNTWWLDLTKDNDGTVHMSPRAGYGNVADGATIEFYIQLNCTSTPSTQFKITDMYFNGEEITNLTQI